MFDTTKSGFIETLKISTILNTMGQLFDDAELQNLIGETDPEGTSSRPNTLTFHFSTRSATLLFAVSNWWEGQENHYI
jgi:Ca2+-binding EF-hand superfamily protein